MAAAKIEDGINKLAVEGTEKIPVSGDNKPTITPNLIRNYIGNWVDFTPSLTGYSSLPSTVIAKYIKIGNLCIYMVIMRTGGTSNSTGLTITLPFQSASLGESQTGIIHYATDNGNLQTSPGLITIGSGASTASLFRTLAAGTWTASGQKRADFTLTYITV